MTYEQEIEKVREITQKIADALKWRVTTPPNDYRGEITDGNITLAIHLEKNRIAIFGSYPGLSNYLPYDREKTDITTSINKSPDKIAQDIKRRLLPGYARNLTRAKEIKQKHYEAEEHKKRVLGELAELMPCPTIKDDDIFDYNLDINLHYCCYDGKIEVKTHLPVETVKKVLAVIYE